MIEQKENFNDSADISSNGVLVCVFCKGTGKAIYIDMTDKTIPDGVVDWDTYGKSDKCPDCNGDGLNADYLAARLNLN